MQNLIVGFLIWIDDIMCFNCGWYVIEWTESRLPVSIDNIKSWNVWYVIELTDFFAHEIELTDLSWLMKLNWQIYVRLVWNWIDGIMSWNGSLYIIELAESGWLVWIVLTILSSEMSGT
jgi:hypothetical protein